MTVPPRRMRTPISLTRMQTARSWETLAGTRGGSQNLRLFRTRRRTMKGDPQVIDYLQAQLKNELTAINQYFLHYRMLKHWGLDKLAKKEYDESIGEMKHADRLLLRIFLLERLPNAQEPRQ